LIVSPIASTVLPAESLVVNSCSSVAEQLCNFVCDCSDCSDENQCGYLRGSAVLGTPFTCDFEEGDCGWQDASTSVFRWVRGRASLATWGTGPYSDHTVGTDLGWFMVTVSPPAKTKATAWLRSPVMRDAAATCEIRAWYHLSGSGLTQLEQPVLRLAMAHGDEVVGLWQSPERGGEGWHQLVAYPGRIAEQFQLIFSLTQPPACGAELALDDIVFRNCGLQAHHRSLPGSLCRPCLPAESFRHCSFEEGLCSWEVEVAQPMWERNTSLNLGTSYGIPTRDHSSNSRAGFFLHVGSTSVTGAGSTARLSSSTLKTNKSCSLVLYCHLHGSATSSLSISYVTNSTKHLVRERTGDLGNCWVRERVEFNVTENFKVLIEGVASGTGTVAIDDLFLSPGCVWDQEEASTTLPSRAGAGPCAAGEVPCDSGSCIDAELACDFAETCADGSDEKRCGATTSEAGAEGWHDVSVGQLRWAVQRATEPTNTVLTGEAIPCTKKMLFGPQPHGGSQCAVTPCSCPARAPQSSLPPRCPQVELLGLVDLQDSATAGIDNVTFVQCHPDVVPPGAAELSCNFEKGMCGWYQDPSSDFQWVRSTGQGQGSDHTTGSGKELAPHPRASGSPGDPAASCPQGPDVPAHSKQPHACGVAFEALRDGFLGDMALDDVALTAGPCGADLSCSFEADTCGLAASGQHSWLRQSNGTGTTAGPPVDHTTGTATGHYMVVSTGRASLPAGHTAALTSQPYQPSAPAQCLAFWYQLSAGTPGECRDPSHQPQHATLNIVRQVIFEAVGAGSDHGYMALDDLHVSDGVCPEPGPPFLPASCDFEQDTCGWSSPADPRLHSFAWGWKNGIPLAKYPGPEQDHTLGTRDGRYVHFDTGVLGIGGTTARLESQHLPAAADACLRFWYHMDIPEHLACGELRVMLQSAAGQRTVWSMAGHQSRGWQSGVAPVQSPSEFQIVFEITTWRWPMEGTVALDDIIYSTGGSCHSRLDMLVEEKPSGSFVAEVVLGLLLAIVILALVATGSWYWLKQRALASGQPAESNAPQGFDNITFRDVRTGVKGSCFPPTTPEQHVPKSSANPSSLPP
ncbi:Mamdc4, partial [Columba guinea]